MKLLFFLFFCSIYSFSMNIGVIDSEYIFNQYSKRILMEQQLEDKRDVLNKEIESLRQELLKKEQILKSKKNFSQEDKEAITNLKKQFQQKINSSEKIFDEEQQNFIYEIKFEIDSAAILIGKEKKLDMVIEKSATIFGGVDLTEDVLNFLNSKDSYKLDSKNLIKTED